MLTVTGTILPMRCTRGTASGTVLWSVLLPASRETVVTHTGLGQGGGVRQGLPLRHGNQAAVVGHDNQAHVVGHDHQDFVVGGHP